jgi:hypothetical protein
LKACLEYLFQRQQQAAFQPLEQSLSAVSFPFGKARLMGHWLFDYGNPVGMVQPEQAFLPVKAKPYSEN